MTRTAPAPAQRTDATGLTTVVVPTFNEGANVHALVRGLVNAFHGQATEILFVDDSNDDTPAVIQDVATAFADVLPVRLIHRREASRIGGLSGAVVEGLRAARGDYVVVMDGDLQHPPSLAPELVRTARLGALGLVVASRNVGDGDSAGLSSGLRRGLSTGSTALARRLFPRRVGRTCSDPMTGFFCVDRSQIDLDRLRPRGFKILLEILVSHDLDTSEIPLQFADRHAGKSKASWSNGLQYLLQLIALRLPRGSLDALAGAAVCLATILALRSWSGMSPWQIGVTALSVMLSLAFLVIHALMSPEHQRAQGFHRREWTPPDSDEKYAYLRLPQHRWIFWAQGIAFIGVAWSLYGMTQNAPWTLVFVVPLVLYTTEQLLALRTSTFRRTITLDSHRESVAAYRPQSWPSVDVFLPTAGEPMPLLRNTYQHVAALQWDGQVQTYVLDDAARPEVEILARTFGFHYLAREGSAFKKAGNLQYGLERSTGDLVTIFDADFVPRPDFLTELVPYLEDETVGIVQSPQYFPTDAAASWLERCAGATQEVFYRFIQPSRDAVGASICVGTSAVYRRKALDAIGGFPQIGHSEDVYTGVGMGRVGFGTRYVPVLVSQGRSPEDLDSFVSQQYRWAEGSLSLLADRAFHEEQSMTILQRLSFWSGFLFYITTAMNAVLAPLAVLVIVWFFPQRVASLDVLPLLGATACWLLLLPMVSHGRWRVEVLRVQAIYGFAHLFCLWDLFRGSVSEWVATNARSEQQPLSIRVRRTMSTYILLTQALVIIGLTAGTARYGIDRYWGNLVLAALGAYILVPVGVLALKRPVAPLEEHLVIDLTTLTELDVTVTSTSLGATLEARSADPATAVA